jgi:tRNA nucleotidyltransferase/poly(A) polymerase
MQKISRLCKGPAVWRPAFPWRHRISRKMVLALSHSPPRGITTHELDLTSSISPSAWEVLHSLRRNGHEAYVVGGTVRDFLLGCKTKDIDVCSSATPEQIRALFPRSRVLGRRFPIVHVRHKKELIEVSSFRTNCDDESQIPLDWYQQQHWARRVKGGRRRQKGGRENTDIDKDGGNDSGNDGGNDGNRKKYAAGTSATKNDAGASWSSARRMNAMKRDFTVNGMLYEPFSRVLFDYVDGVADSDLRLLRTIRPPAESFRDDPARILRALRLSARLGLQIERETEEEMLRAKKRVLDVNHGRLQMELAQMFSYGAAERSYAMLQSKGVLELLLPHHHAKRESITTRILGSIDDSVRELNQPLASVTYNGALFAMLVFADMTPERLQTAHAVDIVDEAFERVTATRQFPKQLMARKALEHACHILREQILLHRDGAQRKEKRPRRQRKRKTGADVLQDAIVQEIQSLSPLL